VSYDWAIIFIHQQIINCTEQGYFGFYIDDETDCDTGTILINDDNIDIKKNYKRLLKLMNKIIFESHLNGSTPKRVFALKAVCGDISKECRKKISEIRHV
jgi:hypothetical protein